jgi:hypothetical protein
MTDEELTRRFDGIDGQFATVDQRFDAMDQRFDHLVAFVKEEGAATRRHFDIVAEAMRADVKLIAEGHGALETSVAGLDARVERVEERQDHVEDRQLALEHRQGKLEQR